MSGNDNQALANAVAWTGLVKGRVQGVFFRAETRRMALRLGVSGWVRNTGEGHVELLICGEPDAIDSMRQWLADGPPMARVDSLELLQCPVTGLEGFTIRE